MTSCTILKEFAGEERLPPWFGAISLALLACALAALWSANVLTMIVSWAIYDLLKAVGYIAAGGTRRGAIRGLVIGGLATLLLWSGLLLAQKGLDSGQWSLLKLGEARARLWALAGLLRLWLYPLHLPALGRSGVKAPHALPLMLDPVLGWGLWLRFISLNDGAVAGGSWALVPAALAFALGGLLAWISESRRCSLPWISMAVNGLVLLAAGLAGQAGIAIVAVGSMTWLLGTTLLYLAEGVQGETLWRDIPALVGALTLLGIPLTPGFVASASLMGEILPGEHLGWVIAFFAGYAFMLPSLTRWLLGSLSSMPDKGWLSCDWPPPSSLVIEMAALGVPTLLLIMTGLYPPMLFREISVPSLGASLAAPGGKAWGLWLAALAAGGVLVWVGERWRLKMKLWLTAIHDLLCLEWFYGALIGAFERGLGLLRVADEVIGGAGALLWSLILFLILLLTWGGK